MNESMIHTTLRQLGITRRYRGFDAVVHCITLAVEDEFRLQSITKEVYMETAAHFGYGWKRVERSLRTAAARAWGTNRALLCQMAGYPLMGAPTASEFVEMIATFLLRNEQVTCIN